MSGAISSSKGGLADFLTPILSNIGEEPTREGLIDLHRLVSGNVASVASKLIGGQKGNLTLTVTTKEYMIQTGFEFVHPHNPGNYPRSMVNDQEQAPETEKFRESQALFWKYIAVQGSFKKQIIMTVEPLFLSPLVD